MTADTNGVTVEDLRDYLASDAPAEFLQRLIEEAESNAHHIVGDDVDIELCRKNSDFNQSHAYPRSFLYRMNQCKWTLRRDAENGSQ